ncbi:MAG: RtcB family protein [Acidobacteria bacterium]|jgi:tRNA-splicing ligase RtcB|nr:RtcB family protein [Acidobacteriota bacterium]
MELKEFNKVSTHRWVLEKDKKKGMKVDAEIFATEEILKTAIEDESVQQVINVSTLPGIVSRSLAMPDIHYGYGFCIGGAAAFPADSGIVLPGGVGYDINCGVRLITTGIEAADMEKYRESVGSSILRGIPTGLTDKSNHELNQKEFLKVLKNGAEEIVANFPGNKEDLRFIESSGKLPFDEPEIISARAIDRGKNQVGSLGGGNHFIEIQIIDEIFDPEAAQVFGLKKGNIAFMIHSGSRGFGHQVASDFIEHIRKKNLDKLERMNIKDPQLIFADINSKEGKQYLQALNAASNFAWANRHLMMIDIISIFEHYFKSSAAKLGIRLVYDQAHNIAKFEQHTIENQKEKLLIHRKGATRAFPPGHMEIPVEYRRIGQPVIIPGSMGTASYVLKGTEKAMEVSFGTSAHGAGRKLSRHKAIKFAADTNVRNQLKEKNILVFTHSKKGLKEEIPEAYKEIDEVVEVTEKTGISEKVARLIPLIVVKG